MVPVVSLMVERYAELGLKAPAAVLLGIAGQMQLIAATDAKVETAQ
jgi:hypothetical protein